MISLDFCLTHAFEETASCGEKIGLIAVTGDLCEDGEAEDYRVLREYLEERTKGIPLAVTLGNHDCKENFRTGWLNEPTEGKKGDQPWHRAFPVEDFWVVSLDNAVHGDSNVRITPAHLEWLKQAFAAAGGRQIILMTHHHMIHGQGPVPPVTYGEEFPELIRTSQVACVLCGHTHHNHEGLLGDKACYTADGMSFYGENLQDGTVRFREKFGYSLLKLEDGIVKERLVRTFDTGRLLGKM